MSALRDEIRAELKRIYWSHARTGSMTGEMADAVVALLEKRK